MGKWKSALEGMGINRLFWKNKMVFLTDHTGFEGWQLSLWLTVMGE